MLFDPIPYCATVFPCITCGQQNMATTLEEFIYPKFVKQVLHEVNCPKTMVSYTVHRQSQSWGFYVPFNSQGRIGKGPQHCHLWESGDSL